MSDPLEDVLVDDETKPDKHVADALRILGHHDLADALAAKVAQREQQDNGNPYAAAIVEGLRQKQKHGSER